MTALYRGGRQADALAAYSNARRILRSLLSAACLVVTSRAALTGLVALEDAHAIALSILSESEARQMVVQRIGIGEQPPIAALPIS